MLLLNNNGKNHKSEKSIESCSMIANSISGQLLENIISDQINIFDARECFSSSEEEIMETCKDEYFTDCTQEEFSNAMYNFHGFKDNYIVITN